MYFDAEFWNPYPLYQKIGYDNAAAVAKKAHKEGCTLKVNTRNNLLQRIEIDWQQEKDVIACISSLIANISAMQIT